MTKYKNYRISDFFNKYFILIEIVNLYFWKSILGPIITFIITPLFSIGMLSINKDYASLVMPSVISSPLFFAPLWLLTVFVFDLKKNSIFERIFVFSKKPIYPNVVLVTYFLILIFLNFIWNIFIVFLMSLDKSIFGSGIFSSIDWESMFFIAILATFLSISISSVLYTFTKSILQCQLIGYPLSLFFMFFSGSVIPIVTINSTSALNYISYFSPFKYINSSFVVAMNFGTGPNNLNNVTIFDFNKDFIVESYQIIDNKIIRNDSLTLFHSYDIVLNIFVPLILTILFFSISLNTKLCRKK